MYGFTGTWQGTPISVQGSGMGQPSMAIYVNELFTEYDVQNIVRVGSCGPFTTTMGIRDVVIASEPAPNPRRTGTASSGSTMRRLLTSGCSVPRSKPPRPATTSSTTSGRLKTWTPEAE
ncbi:hypothetical protein [Streptomyces sp. AK02-04a]|uniref:phosphorylase family protein n=1 Tax=Streptomyces sp. AK02-04a TaxID=3028649 RepID=UPI0039F5949F